MKFYSLQVMGQYCKKRWGRSLGPLPEEVEFFREKMPIVWGLHQKTWPVPEDLKFLEKILTYGCSLDLVANSLFHTAGFMWRILFL